MKKAIWKYVIPMPTGVTTFEIPEGGEVLTVQTQGNDACIWVLVNPDNKYEVRCFEIYGTGHRISYDKSEERKYIGTFQLRNGALVFHVFERTN